MIKLENVTKVYKGDVVAVRDGSFEIKDLPPGTYTLEAWHEKFGTRTAQVTIGEQQRQSVSVTFGSVQ